MVLGMTRCSTGTVTQVGQASSDFRKRRPDEPGRSRLRACATLFFLAVPAAFAATDGDARDFFEARVRPVLAKNCYGCHAGAQMGGLRLDSRERALAGGKSGPAIAPGDPAHSLLIQAVSQSHEKLKMPPQGRLAENEIADLRSWVEHGAIWPETPRGAAAPRAKFWSLEPIRKPSPPAVKNSAWAKTPIDRFIAAALDAKGLAPVAPAGKRELIRRVTFDLTGLPPSPEEADAFVADRSPGAFAKVVDRLLASPRYGERWGRYWLDVARYSDDHLNSTNDAPYENSFRYRDWVINAFNQDMPYDQFVKAQIAGDLMPEREKYQAGLGFFGLSPEFQDDRVDALTRGFLGFTVACAQCHDHKFDPIPTKDYYSLLGVFRSTKEHPIPLAPKDEVERWDARKKKLDDREKELKDFLHRQALELAEILAAKTARYLAAAAAPDSKAAAQADGLDEETLERWVKYLKKADREHPYLPAKDLKEFERFVLSVNAEKKKIDDENHIRLGGSNERGKLASADLLSLARDKYILWRDLFGDKGVLYYDKDKIGRWLSGAWKQHLEEMRADLEAMKKELPPQYPFLHAIEDLDKPVTQHVWLRGNRDSKGEEAPRRFLSALCRDECKPFSQGSGRLELAGAIVAKENPLTARVIANRVWLHHFGQGLVRTPSNFGQLGERPSHPELLDYLASRLMENNWSLKALHREILLTSVYALSTQNQTRNFAADPENRLLWRANRRRLDVEAMRDALLAAAGRLDLSAGGPAKPLTDDNRRRTVYGFVSRRKLDGLLSLFDFPNPNNTSEQRMATNVPLQRLFFLNSGFVETQAKALAGRLQGTDTEKITEAYRLLYGRPPERRELDAGLEFLRSNESDVWPKYAQVLLSSNEFGFVN